MFGRRLHSWKESFLPGIKGGVSCSRLAWGDVESGQEKQGCELRHTDESLFQGRCSGGVCKRSWEGERIGVECVSKEHDFTGVESLEGLSSKEKWEWPVRKISLRTLCIF